MPVPYTRLPAALLAALLALTAGCTFLQNPLFEAPTTLRFDTTAGEFVLELSSTAPDTSDLVETLARDGFYDNTVFHRVTPGFIVEAGRFERALVANDLGNPVANETATSRSNQRASFALVPLEDAPDQVALEFIINLSDNTELDATFPVIGDVISGLDVVTEIANTPTTTVGDFANVPIRDIIVTSTTQQENPNDPLAPFDLLFTTSAGEFLVRLDLASAPTAAQYFADRFEAGDILDTIFHAARSGESVRGGLYTSQLVEKPSGATRTPEDSVLSNTQGTTALLPEPETDTASPGGFYVNLVDNPILDGTSAAPGSAIFGQVISGFDVLQSIGDLPTRTLDNRPNVPFEFVTISAVTVERGDFQLSTFGEVYVDGVRFNVLNLIRDLAVTGLGGLIDVLLS